MSRRIKANSFRFSRSSFLRLGLDPKLLAKILNMSSGRCWSSDTYNPVPGVMEGVPASNNYQGGFGTTLMAKVIALFVLSFDFRFYDCPTIAVSGYAKFKNEKVRDLMISSMHVLNESYFWLLNGVCWKHCGQNSNWMGVGGFLTVPQIQQLVGCCQMTFPCP